MWLYEQSSGMMSHNGTKVAQGYSGYEQYKNDPAYDNVHNCGPLPRGKYTIETPRDTPDHGPFVLPLEPDPANIMHGREGFLIHGDSLTHPGMASFGCIILSRPVRVQIWDSGDHDLTVIPKEET